MKSLVPLVILLLAVGAMSAANSANSVSPARPSILAQATPEVCTEIYQPVCGTDANGKRVTYSNACFARAAKATGVTSGECAK